MSMSTCVDRLVQDAMSGKYLDNSFSLPCPPGLHIPPEVLSPFTSNNLKVNCAWHEPSALFVHTVHPMPMSETQREFCSILSNDEGAVPHFFFSILEQICLICTLKSLILFYLLRVFPCWSSLPTLSRFLSSVVFKSKQFNKDSYILEAKVE